MPDSTNSNLASIKELSDQGGGGARMGLTSSDLIGFLGVSTLVSRQATYTAVGTTAATSTTPYGFATTTQANAVTTALTSIKTALDAYGLTA